MPHQGPLNPPGSLVRDVSVEPAYSRLIPWPLAVRPVELRAMRRAVFRRSPITNEICSEMPRTTDGGHGVVATEADEPDGGCICEFAAPNGGYHTEMAPSGGLPNTTSSGRGWLFLTRAPVLRGYPMKFVRPRSAWFLDGG